MINNNDKNTKLYTPREIADQLKVARGTVYAAISKGDLQSFKIGRNRRISEEQLRLYLEARRVVVLDMDLPGNQYR